MKTAHWGKSAAGLTGGFQFGMMTMVASVLTVAVAAGYTSPRIPALPRFLMGRVGVFFGAGLCVGFAVWLVRGLVFGGGFGDGLAWGIVYGFVGGLVAGLVGLRDAGPQPTCTRLQVRGRIRILTRRFTVGFAIGITAAGAYGIGDAILSGTANWVANGVENGVTVGLVVGTVYGFEAPLNADEVISASDSRARDRNNSVRKMLAAAVLIGSIFATSNGFVAGIADGLLAGWLSMRVTSAWFFWMVLVRGWLPLTGKLPWRVRDFLTDAHQRGVLRQTGPVYQFRHATLQDHFTTEGSSRQPRANR